MWVLCVSKACFQWQWSQLSVENLFVSADEGSVSGSLSSGQTIPITEF